MYLVNFKYLLFISPFLLCTPAYEHTNSHPLTPFGKKVLSYLPENVYDKTFGLHFKKPEEFYEAVPIAADRLNGIVGIPTDPAVVKKLQDEARRLYETGVNLHGLLFHLYTNSISRYLVCKGKLNSGNVDEVARKFVKELYKAAATVCDDSVTYTLPALETAVGKLFVLEDVTSEKDVAKYIKIFIEEHDKY